ncbi:MAG: addiction module antidote protein, HigA family [Peredibacter sp.]|nr:addiction module antidote protein, HigA family [Peredibacter sp.]
MLPKDRKPTHPGQILLLEFLEPMGKTQKDLATHLGWTYAKVNEIVNGRRGVTEESALCFSDVFGTSAEFWLNLQMNHDLWIAMKEHKKAKPISASA